MNIYHMRLSIRGSDAFKNIGIRQVVQGSILVFCLYEATKIFYEYQYKHSVQMQDILLFGFSLLLVLLPTIIKVIDSEGKFKKFVEEHKNTFYGSALGGIFVFATKYMWDGDIEPIVSQ